MGVIDEVKAELKIKEVLEEIKEALDTEVLIDGECRPSAFFKSQVLVTAIGRIAAALDIEIPLNCYIFFDKRANKQLTIKEATQKLLKEAKNGN